MKLLFKALVMMAAIGLGLTLGFALRGKHVSSVPGKEGAVSEKVAKAHEERSLSKRGASVRFNDDSPLATKLERDLSMSSGVTRWLYWLEAIEKAAPADFPRLLRLAQGNATAMRFVAARWAQLAPRHMLDNLLPAAKTEPQLRYELADILFREWPKTDPDGMIAALSLPGVPSDWRHDAASGICEQDPERGLRLMADWHIVSFTPLMGGITKWAADDPRHAAEFTLENPSGAVSQSTMKVIGQQWAKTDPAAAIEFAAGKPDELATTLAATALKAWSQRDLNEAANWLAAADPQVRNRLSSPFVEVWAKQDASGALNWCAENLTGSSLAGAVGGVLRGAAERDVVGAAALVSAMEPSPARSEGAVAVAKKWFPDSITGKPVPPETVAWITSLDADSARRVLDNVVWEWSRSDSKSMAAFLTARSDINFPTHTYTILARQMAQQNPFETLQWAGQLPGEHSLEAGGEAFAQWRSLQPDAAMKWLNDLPADDARRQAYFKSAIESLAYHPQAADQFAALSVADRVAARSIIERMPVAEDRKATLLALLQAR